MKRAKRVTEAPAVYRVRAPKISRATIRSVVSTIADRFKPEKIVIFGSCAQGKTRTSSDLDLLVIMKSDLPRHKRTTPIRLLFDPTPCPMDILVFTPDEVRQWNGTVNHIITEAMEKGVVAYEKPGPRTGETVDRQGE